MRRIVRGDTAERDLEEIFSYLDDHSPPAADRFIAKLDSVTLLLASQPHIGRTREDLVSEMRSMVVDKYIVFYTSTDEEVSIVRIIHGSRNITPEQFHGV